tara:strand:+ start:185 stop:1120 length:936 start_codon:yes stop_codon:yes gene_type:complete
MGNDRLGILLILLGMSFFSIQDVLIKFVILDASLLQILVLRAFLGSIILASFLYFTKRPIKLGSAYPAIAIFRGISFFIGFTLFYISLTKISLAEANSLFFVNPVFMTIFSVLILKNSIGFHRLGAIILGLLGTLLIIKPSFTNFNWYMLLPIITAISYAISMTLSKMTSDKDNSFQQSFHIYLGGFIFGTLISIAISNNMIKIESEQLQFLTNPWTFLNLKLLIPMLIIAITGTIGIFSLVSAYRIGSPQTNAPFEYVLLIYSLITGYLIFGEIPDKLSLFGMALIIFSGIYIFIRESIKRNFVAVIKSR